MPGFYLQLCILLYNHLPLMHLAKMCDQEFKIIYVCIYFFLILAEFFTLALDNVSSLLSFKRKSLRLEESFSQMVPYPKR